MAVETKHLNLFTPQLLFNNRGVDNNTIQQNANIYNKRLTTNHQPQIYPSYNGGNVITTPHDNYHMLLQHNTQIKPEISTDSNNLNLQRKRRREYSIPSSNPSNYSNNYTQPVDGPLDLSLQLQQHLLEIDGLVSQHMEKVRLEVEEKRKAQARRIMEAVEEGMVKRVKAKEEEILKIGKLNWALEERVKSLCIENQIWKDLAQTNEATANALRTNLEQVLSRRTHCVDEAITDDAQSSCGSCDAEELHGGQSRHKFIESTQDKSSNVSTVHNGVRLCKICGEEESCVLLLPCRHLCLCGRCGSRVHVCPICNATKNASFHVNMS